MSFPPGATLKPTKFVAHIDEKKKLSVFQTLFELSPIEPPMYENTTRLDGQYGIGRQWLMDIERHMAQQIRLEKNGGQNQLFSKIHCSFEARDDATYTVHFLALLSQNPQAVPVCLIHGWPGSFIEFLSFLDVAKSKYSQKYSPYHFIVPSLPGYAYSCGPSVKKEWNNEGIAFVMNKLMVGLGFSGYIAYGGDIGSFISRILAVSYDACKAILLNFCLMAEEPKGSTQPR